MNSSPARRGASAANQDADVLFKQKPNVLATVSPGVVIPERGATPKYVWLFHAYANPGQPNQEVKVYQATKKVVAMDLLKAFIARAAKNKLPSGDGKTSDLVVRTEFFDQTGAGVVAVYFQGRMYERWVESPEGLLGPRCSPFPRAPLDVPSGIDWPESGFVANRIETRRGGRDDDYLGRVSVEERNRVTKSAKNLQGFAALLDSGRVGAKIGGSGKPRLAIAPHGKKLPAGYRKLKGPQWAALVMGARMATDVWVTQKAFEGYPLISNTKVLVEHFGPQKTTQDAMKLPVSEGNPQAKAKAEPKAEPKAKVKKTRKPKVPKQQAPPETKKTKPRGKKGSKTVKGVPRGTVGHKRPVNVHPGIRVQSPPVRSVRPPPPPQEVPVRRTGPPPVTVVHVGDNPPPAQSFDLAALLNNAIKQAL